MAACPEKNGGNGRVPPWAQQLIFVLLLAAIWEGLSFVGFWPEYVFPSPLQVGETLYRGLADYSLGYAVLESLRRLLQGYFIALVCGLVLGALLARLRWLKNTVGAVALGLQTLPSICWLPLALLWFGLNERAMIFVVVMGALFAITQATEDGIRNTAPIFVRAAMNLGARGVRLYVSVILPAAMPSIVSGMKLGWAFAWRSLMAAELIYTLPGLGNMLNMGRELNDMSQVIAVMTVIVCLGLLSDHVFFAWMEHRVRERWGLCRR